MLIRTNPIKKSFSLKLGTPNKKDLLIVALFRLWIRYSKMVTYHISLQIVMKFKFIDFRIAKTHNCNELVLDYTLMRFHSHTLWK